MCDMAGIHPVFVRDMLKLQAKLEKGPPSPPKPSGEEIEAARLRYRAILTRSA